MAIKESLSKYFKSHAGALTVATALITPTLGGAGLSLVDVFTAYESGSNTKSQTQIQMFDEKFDGLSDKILRLKSIANVAKSQTDMAEALKASDMYAAERKQITRDGEALFSSIVTNKDLTEEDMQDVMDLGRDLARESANSNTGVAQEFSQVKSDYRHYRYAKECAVDLTSQKTNITAEAFNKCTADYRQERVKQVMTYGLGGIVLSVSFGFAAAPISRSIGNGVSNIGRRRRRKSTLGNN